MLKGLRNPEITYRIMEKMLGDDGWRYSDLQDAIVKDSTLRGKQFTRNMFKGAFHRLMNQGIVETSEGSWMLDYEQAGIVDGDWRSHVAALGRGWTDWSASRGYHRQKLIGTRSAYDNAKLMRDYMANHEDYVGPLVVAGYEFSADFTWFLFDMDVPRYVYFFTEVGKDNWQNTPHLNELPAPLKDYVVKERLVRWFNEQKEYPGDSMDRLMAEQESGVAKAIKPTKTVVPTKKPKAVAKKKHKPTGSAMIDGIFDKVDKLIELPSQIQAMVDDAFTKAKQTEAEPTKLTTQKEIDAETLEKAKTIILDIIRADPTMTDPRELWGHLARRDDFPTEVYVMQAPYSGAKKLRTTVGPLGVLDLLIEEGAIDVYPYRVKEA